MSLKTHPCIFERHIQKKGGKVRVCLFLIQVFFVHQHKNSKHKYFMKICTHAIVLKGVKRIETIMLCNHRHQKITCGLVISSNSLHGCDWLTYHKMYFQILKKVVISNKLANKNTHQKCVKLQLQELFHETFWTPERAIITQVTLSLCHLIISLSPYLISD